MTMPFARTVRLVVLGGTISYRALFNWTNPPMFVGTLLAAPVIQLVFFVYLGRHLNVADDSFYIVGNATLAASAPSVFGGTMAVANERKYATLGAVLLSPRSRMALWLGRGLPYTLNGLLVATFTLVAGVLLFSIDLPMRTLLALVPVLLVSAASCSAFGLVLGGIGLRFRDVMLISNVSFTLLLLLTGTNVPRSAMPGWMSFVGSGLPMTHAAQAARSLVAGDPLGRVLAQVGAEVVVGVGYALAAVLLLRYLENSSRRRATLDLL